MIDFILRVHHADSVLRGMYASYASIAMDDGDGRHPLPFDMRELITAQHYFGFKGKQEFSAWVHTRDIREALSNEGFVISLFCGPTDFIFHGKGQSTVRENVLNGTSGMLIQQLPVSRWEEMWRGPPKELMMRTLQSLGRME